MTPVPIPDENSCMALLEKYETPQHIIMHSRTVWSVAKVLGEALLRKNHQIDMMLLEACCLLHDIAKYPCLVDGARWHDRRGEEILTEEGLPEVGRIVGQHVILQDINGEQIREEHLLYYSDKRVVHDRIVSLADRFAYLAETYGRNPNATELIQEWNVKTVQLEERIFKLLDFRPDQVAEIVAETI